MRPGWVEGIQSRMAVGEVSSRVRESEIWFLWELPGLRTERGQRGASQGHHVPEQLAPPLPFPLPRALGPEASTLRLSRRSSQPEASHHVRLSPEPRLQGGSWARWPHCCTLYTEIPRHTRFWTSLPIRVC